ncbi:MAG: SDR family NAD(P)-dependent oxidoreductase [Cyanobacteria bacterium J06627_8]
MRTLAGKNAIVTGSSRGIGAAIAKKPAAEGAFVLINYGRSANSAQQVVEETQPRDKKAALVQADMATIVGVDALFEEANRLFSGQLDVALSFAMT